ncbi:hypothetical protein [Curtobacterium sp. MCSS17_016]|uniref:hypothetical protein n=1 Tax=Curtobacterium sp. MCSS17_016 TaxID=2175644 RepID=UPI000DAABFEC|nr:hypothetical protein [Curtobacterium sp. MCSS17_016]WIE81305.1 hypothetical protein DEJ19_018905 [Curtobacterium sp. MCSS17_016]
MTNSTQQERTVNDDIPKYHNWGALHPESRNAEQRRLLAHLHGLADALTEHPSDADAAVTVSTAYEALLTANFSLVTDELVASLISLRAHRFGPNNPDAWAVGRASQELHLLDQWEPRDAADVRA